MGDDKSFITDKANIDYTFLSIFKTIIEYIRSRSFKYAIDIDEIDASFCNYFALFILVPFKFHHHYP